MAFAQHKIGFTGTQRGLTEPQRDALFRLLCEDGFRQIIHHGDCIGADAEAHDIAVRFGMRTIAHVPSNNAKRAFTSANEYRQPKPYLERNKDIVRETDRLVACPGEDTEQLRSGTWSTVRYARKVGKPVWIILPNGRVLSPKTGAENDGDKAD